MTRTEEKLDVRSNLRQGKSCSTCYVRRRGKRRDGGIWLKTVSCWYVFSCLKVRKAKATLTSMISNQHFGIHILSFPRSVPGVCRRQKKEFPLARMMVRDISELEVELSGSALTQALSYRQLDSRQLHYLCSACSPDIRRTIDSLWRGAEDCEPFIISINVWANSSCLCHCGGTLPQWQVFVLMSSAPPPPILADSWFSVLMNTIQQPKQKLGGRSRCTKCCQ